MLLLLLAVATFVASSVSGQGVCDSHLALTTTLRVAVHKELSDGVYVRSFLGGVGWGSSAGICSCSLLSSFEFFPFS
jgi:hypothetical protein